MTLRCAKSQSHTRARFHAFCGKQCTAYERVATSASIVTIERFRDLIVAVDQKQTPVVTDEENASGFLIVLASGEPAFLEACADAVNERSHQIGEYLLIVSLWRLKFVAEQLAHAK